MHRIRHCDRQWSPKVRLRPACSRYVADGFEAAAVGGGGWVGDGDGRVGADADRGERHNGKAKNKAYPRVIRNS